jgi:hypothetical protein
MNASKVHAIEREGLWYTHGYPSGSWGPFPKLQLYQSKGAATRQANKLPGAKVVPLVIYVSPK